MTATILVSIFSVILSLCASYIPKFRIWYAKLTSARKKLFMFFGVILIAAGVFLLSCLSYLSYFTEWVVTCDMGGAIGLVKVVGTALIANQATFLIAPKVESVKRVWNGD